MEIKSDNISNSNKFKSAPNLENINVTKQQAIDFFTSDSDVGSVTTYPAPSVTVYF